MVEFENAVRRFYLPKNAAGASTDAIPSDDASSTLFSKNPPEARTIVDDQLLESVFEWLCQHPEIEVRDFEKVQGDNGDFQHQQQQSSFAHTMADQRIFATEEKMWHVITGHGIDRQRVSALEFDILSVVAAHGPSGVLQPFIFKITGQDKRSVPKRTDALERKGYISKEAVVASGQNTALLKFMRFPQVPGISVPGNTKAAPNTIIRPKSVYRDWFDGTIGLLKQNRGIVATRDLRIKLRVELKFEKKILDVHLRRIVASGCIRRVTAKMLDKDGNSTLGRSKCVQLLRDPTELDRTLWLNEGTKDIGADMSDSDNEEDPADASANRDLPPDIQGAAPASNAGATADSEVLGEENSSIDLTKDPLPPQWDPDVPLSNTLHVIIELAGQEGINSAEIAKRATGPQWQKPLEEILSQLTDVCQYSQPPDLRHFTLIKDTSNQRRTHLWKYRTLQNFTEAVESGITSWNAIKQTLNPKAKKDLLTAVPDLDEWEFPKVPQKDLAAREGRATLAEGRTDLPLAQLGSDDDEILRDEDGDEDEEVDDQESPMPVSRVRPRAAPSKKKRASSRDTSQFLATASSIPRLNAVSDQHAYGMRQRKPATVAPAALLADSSSDNDNDLGQEIMPEPMTSAVPPTRTERSYTKRVVVETPVPRVREIPEADYAEYELFAQKVAEGRARAEIRAERKAAAISETDENDDDQNREPNPDRITVFKEQISACKLPGVYINPPGARQIKTASVYSRGRPRKALIAVFKSPRLHDLGWFKDDLTARFVPAPSKRRTTIVSESIDDTNEDVDPNIDTEAPTPKRRRIQSAMYIQDNDSDVDDSSMTDKALEEAELSPQEIVTPERDESMKDWEVEAQSGSIAQELVQTLIVRLPIALPEDHPAAKPEVKTISEHRDATDSSDLPALSRPSLSSVMDTSGSGPLPSSQPPTVFDLPLSEVRERLERLRRKRGRKSDKDKSEFAALERALYQKEQSIVVRSEAQPSLRQPEKTISNANDAIVSQDETHPPPSAVPASGSDVPTAVAELIGTPVPFENAEAELRRINTTRGPRSSQMVGEIEQLKRQIQAEKSAPEPQKHLPKQVLYNGVPTGSFDKAYVRAHPHEQFRHRGNGRYIRETITVLSPVSKSLAGADTSKPSPVASTPVAAQVEPTVVAASQSKAHGGSGDHSGQFLITAASPTLTPASLYDNQAVRTDNPNLAQGHTSKLSSGDSSAVPEIPTRFSKSSKSPSSRATIKEPAVSIQHPRHTGTAPLTIIRPYIQSSGQTALETIPATVGIANRSTAAILPKLVNRDCPDDEIDGTRSESGVKFSKSSPGTDAAPVAESDNTNVLDGSSLQPVQTVQQKTFASRRPPSAYQLERQGIILKTVRDCGGVFPGDAEVFYVLVTAWKKLHGETPGRDTVDRAIQQLLDQGKLQKFTFSIADKAGQSVERHLLAEPQIDLNSPVAVQMRLEMTRSHPMLYLPAEADISDDLRAKKHRLKKTGTAHPSPLPASPGPISTLQTQAIATDREHRPQKVIAARPSPVGASPGPLSSLQSQVATTDTGLPVEQSEGDRDLREKVPVLRIEEELTVHQTADAAAVDDQEALKKGFANARALREHQHTQAILAKRRAATPRLLAPKATDTLKRKADQSVQIFNGDASSGDLVGFEGEFQVDGYDHTVLVDDETPRPYKQPKITRQVTFSHAGMKPTQPAIRKPLGSLRTSILRPRRKWWQEGPQLPKSASRLLMNPAQAYHPITGTFSSSGLAVARKPSDSRDFDRRTLALKDAAWENLQSQDWANIIQRASGLPGSHVENDQDSESADDSEEAALVSTSDGETPPPDSNKKAKRLYKSRGKRRRADDEDAAHDSDDEQDPTLHERKTTSTGNRKDFFTRDRHSSAAFAEIEHLIVAIALVSAVCGGINQDRMNWNLVSHAMSFRYEGDFLRRRWSQYRKTRKLDADQLRDAIREPFLEAYERNELPSIDFSKLGNTDWPALVEWVQNTVHVTNKRRNNEPSVLDLPVSRAHLEATFIVDERTKLFEPDPNDYFTTVTDMNRKHLALRYTHGNTLPGQMRPREELRDDLLLLKSWVRAVAMTKNRNYNAEEAARKIGTFGVKTLKKVATEMTETKMFIQDKKGRHLPGRNYQIHNDVLIQFRRWPAGDGNEHRYLARIAQGWANINSHFMQGNDQLALIATANDGEYTALSNMCAQGFLHVTPILPERKDDFDAPFPKLTPWSYGGASYETKKVDQSVLRFPLLYTKQPGYKYHHELIPNVPLPTHPALVPGEAGHRIPFWVDIHGNIIDDIFDMTMRSVLHLIVFRPGLKPTAMEDAHGHKLWAWEIQLMLEWMEQSGIAVRCGDAVQEIGGVVQEGWRASEWWYCAFVPEMLQWAPPPDSMIMEVRAQSKATQ